MKRAKRPFWKLILVCLLADAAGFGLLYLFEIITWATPVAIKYTVLASLGVVAGSFTRLILARHTGMFRVSAAAFALVTALWLTDWRTNGFVGIAPIDLNHPYPGWDGLLQLFTVWSVMLLALHAWKRKKQLAPAPAFPLPSPAAQPFPGASVLQSTAISQLQPASGPSAPSEKAQSISEALLPILSQLKTWPAQVRPVKKSARPIPRDLPQMALDIASPVLREPVLLPPHEKDDFHERKTTPLPQEERAGNYIKKGNKNK